MEQKNIGRWNFNTHQHHGVAPGGKDQANYWRWLELPHEPKDPDLKRFVERQKRIFGNVYSFFQITPPSLTSLSSASRKLNAWILRITKHWLRRACLVFGICIPWLLTLTGICRFPCQTSFSLNLEFSSLPLLTLDRLYLLDCTGLASTSSSQLL